MTIAKANTRKYYPKWRDQYKPDRKVVPDSILLKGLGDTVISTIPVPRSVPVDVDVAFRDVTGVGGYNWIDGEDERPTIVVPGIPNVWCPPEKLGKIEPEYKEMSEIEYSNQNSARLIAHGISSLEPIFHSLSEPINLSTYDLITDRANLRKLFHHIDGPRRNDALEWRIDANLVPNKRTVLFGMGDEHTIPAEEKTPPGIGWKFGSGRAVTRLWRGDHARGCHRLVSYNWGGLRVLVGFAIDACFSDDWNDHWILLDDDEQAKEGNGSKFTQNNNSSLNDHHLAADSDEHDLNVINRDSNAHPAHSDLLDIRTRAMNREFDPVESYLRLVFSQTPDLNLAKHDSGDFGACPIRRISLSAEDLLKVAEYKTDSLRKMVKLLPDMLKTVRECCAEKGNGLSFVARRGEIEARELLESREELSPFALDMLGGRKV